MLPFVSIPQFILLVRISERRWRGLLMERVLIGLLVLVLLLVLALALVLLAGFVIVLLVIMAENLLNNG